MDSAQAYNEESSQDYFILSSMAIVLNIFIMIGFIFWLFFHCDDESNSAAVIARRRRNAGLKLQERYLWIETWLVSKRVCPHDELTKKLVTIARSHNHQRTSHSQRTRDNENLSLTSSQQEQGCVAGEATTLNPVTSSVDNEFEGDFASLSSSSGLSTAVVDDCQICYDSILIGEIASWSRLESGCHHVFHHGCIKEWILRSHQGCPICRQDFVPSLPFSRRLWRLCRQHENEVRRLNPSQPHEQSFYCQGVGVIYIPNDGALRQHLSSDEFEEAQRRMRHVPAEELRKLRGYDVDERVRVGVDVMSMIVEDSAEADFSSVGDIPLAMEALATFGPHEDGHGLA